MLSRTLCDLRHYFNFVDMLQQPVETSAARACADCGEPISDRADKKFCSDYCRNAYHNKQNGGATHYVRHVNSSLRKNRKILQTLNPNGKIKLPKKKLLDEGFNFDFHTNTSTTRKGATYYFCYEHGYLPLDGDWLMLVEREYD